MWGTWINWLDFEFVKSDSAIALLLVLIPPKLGARGRDLNEIALLLVLIPPNLGGLGGRKIRGLRRLKKKLHN